MKLMICIFYRFCFVLFVANSVVITYNAALNRPAYQSGVYLNRYPARLANDGSRNTSASTGSKCAHSDLETNPWWAVDLGHPTTTYRVNLTNRGDGWGRL